MTTLTDIHEEIDRLSERRTELWHALSEGFDAGLKEELHRIETRLNELWEEQRELRARMRFGDRDEIVRRARQEERLSRAA